MKKTLNKLASIALAGLLVLGSASTAFAAAPTDASNNMTRQKISEAADHALTFELGTDLASAETVIVTFTDFTGTAAPTGAGWTAGPAANQITYTAAALVTAGTALPVAVTGLINPATAGNRSITIIADNGDTGSVLVPIILDDQIRITARVDQTLTFDVQDGIDGIGTIGDNNIGFGDLTSANTRFATADAVGSDTIVNASQLFAETNAPGGYIIDVEGDTLRSMENSVDVIDALTTATAAPAAGTEAFGFKVNNFTQTAAGASAVSTLADVVEDDFEDFNMTAAVGTAEVLATQTGPSDNDVYDLAYIANINALTEAGNYATTLTFTMTANF